MNIQRSIGSKSTRILAVVMVLMIMLSGFTSTSFAASNTEIMSGGGADSGAAVQLEKIVLDENSYSLNIGDTHQTVVTAVYSDAGSKVSPKTPKLLNMTFNGDPKTSRAFAWYTGPEIKGTKLQVVEASKVKDGVFSGQEATTYTGGADIISTFMTERDRESEHYTKFASHKVIADGLKPGTKYAYRAGNGDEDGWSDIGSFTTDADGKQGFHFAVGSDSQGSDSEPFEAWQDTFRKAIDNKDDPPKFFILSGDLVDNGDLESQWQWCLGIPHKEFANVPIVPVLGGHEVKDYDEDETTDNDNFYNHFNLPKEVVEGTQPGSVYSFEYGDALFMQFNSQFAGEVDKDGNIKDSDDEFWAQLQWMKNQVAKTDKKWKFVSFHKGPYSIGDNATFWEGDRMKFYRKYLIPVFDELGVDMVFVAHDHMYMRSYQMLNDKPVEGYDQYDVTNPKGTVYVETNSVGNKFYHEWHVGDVDEEGNVITQVPDDYFSWKDVQPYKKMFMDVSLTKDKLEFTAYTAAKDEPVKEYDHYNITRTGSKPAKVENAKVSVVDGKLTLTWDAPVSDGSIKEYRIYEKNDKIGANWSAYVPAAKGQVKNSYTVNEKDVDANASYEFVIKAANERLNSDAVTVIKNGSGGSEGPGKPYPQHTSYTAGSIKPNNVTQAQMDKEVQRIYGEWKERYLTRNKYDVSQYYVYYNRDGESDEDTPDAVTTSEAHGYGMLVTALMAGSDPKAKTYFDGLYRFYKAHPSSVNPDLMSWQQADRDGKIIDVNGQDSATDGDMDIAYALLLADKQWGSNGEINYLAQAKKIISAVMKNEVNASERILKLGDWVDDNDPKYGKATRPSDFMLQHLKDFGKVSGDNRWNEVVDKTYSIIQSLYQNYSPNTGLLPDFTVKNGSGYVPPSGNLLESDEDGYYNWNSCRTPWRIATDYLMTGDTRAKAQLDKMNAWIRSATGGKPENIKQGYKLGGTALDDDPDTAFTAPFMVSAMVDSANQEWLNKLWSYNVSQPTDDGAYFGNSIRLLNMIVVSGNWWSPTKEEPGNGGGGGSKHHHNNSDKTDTPNTTDTPVPVQTPEHAKKTFSDLGNYPWAKDAIETLASKGIINGTSKTTFEPGKNITRADFITLLVRALDLKADGNSNFADIQQNAYYYKALGIAKELGIATGVGGNRFNPEEEISRQDMMVLVARALKVSQKVTKSGAASDIDSFADASQVAGYATEGVATLIKEGIIQGNKNAINPKGTATRAETALIIYRVYSKYMKD